MNSAQTILHLLKNDIRRQGWLLYSWVLLGSAFIAIIFCLRWAMSTTLESVARGAYSDTLDAIVTVISTSGSLWIHFAAPLILALNILSADPPSGSDRFWMTRPVSGKILFLEKSLLVLFIIGFHSVLLYCIIRSGSDNEEFFIIYAVLIPLFAVLLAQLTILPRKFVSVICLVAFAFIVTQIFNCTIFSRVELLIREPIQISLLPSILALLIPLVFVGIGIANQYFTRRTKRSVALFALSALVTIGVTENFSVPLEFLEIKEAIPCKGTIESSEKDFEVFYQTRNATKEKKIRCNITCFNVPRSEANCYWSPYATKNPNVQHWGDWIYQDYWFNLESKVSLAIGEKSIFRNSDLNGIRNVLNEDLSNPSWLTQKKILEESFAQEAVFVSGGKETKLPLQIFLREQKLTREAEAPLKKNNFINLEKDGKFSFGDIASNRPFIHIKEESDEKYSLIDHGFPSDVFIVLYNPRRNEARFFGNYPSLGYGVSPHPHEKDPRIISAEWSKDAQIIVYHISDTGRTGLATLENPTTPTK